MEKRDIRLYFYKHGTLKKWGWLRDSSATMRHYFDDVEECVEHIHNKILLADYISKEARKRTYVVVEYLGTEKSEIVCLVNKLNCLYLQ